jgi:hypothetical protein
MLVRRHGHCDREAGVNYIYRVGTVFKFSKLSKKQTFKILFFLTLLLVRLRHTSYLVYLLMDNGQWLYYYHNQRSFTVALCTFCWACGCVLSLAYWCHE